MVRTGADECVAAHHQQALVRVERDHDALDGLNYAAWMDGHHALQSGSYPSLSE